MTPKQIAEPLTTDEVRERALRETINRRIWRRMMGKDRPAQADQVAGVMEWLRRSDGRLVDVFSLWTQGLRDDRWVAETLISEGHLAALPPSRRHSGQAPLMTPDHRQVAEPVAPPSARARGSAPEHRRRL
jgi:hypothetical protein